MTNFLTRLLNRSSKTTGSQKADLEINILADGQLSIAGMDVQLTGAQIEDELNGHLEKIRSIHAELTTKVQAVNPAQDEQAQRLKQLQASIRSANNDKLSKDYVRSFLNIAEIYETLAIIDDQTGGNGSTTWDLAWDILNRESLKVAIAVTRGEPTQLSEAYAELLFARGTHYMRKMKYAPEPAEQNKNAQSAATMFFIYLLVIYKIGLSHWQMHDAVRNIYLAANVGKISEGQLQTIVTDVSGRPTVQQPGDAMKQAVQTVKDYAPTESDRQRPLASIY